MTTQKLSIRERLERRTERVGDCLIWTGKTDSNGYGAITTGPRASRKTRSISRVSYEEFIGPIPDGYDVDHTCHSRDPEACPGRPNCLHIRCWNPEHLQAVTRAENVRGRKSWRGRKTHCANGHEYTPENSYVVLGARTVRRCVACREARKLAKQQLAI